jgi:hypothetical protein
VNDFSIIKKILAQIAQWQLDIFGWRDGRVAEGAGLLSQSDHFVTVRDSDFPRATTASNDISANSLF